MLNDLRFELSFKNTFQLENKLNFCISNNINKINIPCKGVIKKDFLNETIKYIGENYKNLDVTYHYSLYHQYAKNREYSYLEFLNFIKKCKFYKNNEILLIEILIPIISKKNIIKQHTNKMEPISEKFDNAGNLNDLKKDFCI